MQAHVTRLCLGTLLMGTLLVYPSAICAAVVTASPGDDLQSLIAAMRDGDTLALSSGEYGGGVFVEGRSISIAGPLTGQAVIVPPEATNVLIGIMSGANVHIERLSFRPSDAATFALYVKEATASCLGCEIEDAPDASVYVEAGTLTLSGGHVAVRGGNGVVAVNGSTLIVEGLTISGPSSMAIAGSDTSELSLDKLTIEGGGGVLVTGATGATTIANSTIVSSGNFAVQVQSSGPVSLSGNEFRGGDAAVMTFLSGTAALDVSGNIAVAPNLGIYVEGSEGATAEVVLTGNRVVASGTGATNGLRLVGVPRAAVTSNTILGAGDVAVSVGAGATVAMQGNIIAGTRYGVASTDDPPGTATLNDEVIFAESAASDSVGIDSMSARSLAALSADADRQAAVQVDLATVFATETLADIATIGRIAAAAADIRTAAKMLSTVGLMVTDASGRGEPAPFVVLDEMGATVAESEDGRQVAIRPGTYNVALNMEASASLPVDVALGEEKTANLTLPRSLWLDLTYSNAPRPRLALFHALPEENVARLVATDGYDWRLETIRAFPRATATPEDIAKALQLARAAVTALPSLATDGQDDLWDKTWWARAPARRIIAVYGEESDAQLLIDNALGAFSDNQVGAVAAAYLEARLGRLADGAVRSAMDSEDEERAFAAASALNAMGVPAANERLLKWAHQGTSARLGEIFYQLRRQGDPEALAYSRKRLDEFIAGQASEKPPYFPVGTLTDLIAFGDESDWRLMGQALRYVRPDDSRQVARQLAPFAVDPLSLTDAIASYIEADGVNAQVDICVRLRERGPQRFAVLNQGMQDQIDSWWKFINDERYTNYLQYYLSAGGCWPNETSAKYYHTGETELADSYQAFAWMPEFWHVDKLLASEAAGTLSSSYFDQIDFLPLSSVAKALNDSSLQNRDLRLSYRTVLTRAGYWERLHTFEDGLERRPFLLRHVDAPDYSGSIGGMVVVDPQLHPDGRLVIRLRIEEVPYYHGCCDLASTIANNNDLSKWLHAPFLLDGGSALVKSVSLRRNGVDVPVILTGPHALGFRIDAGQSPNGLAGLVLTVELELFGDRRVLIYDLFASGRARGFGMR
jgi:hypothetical protein